MTDTLTLTRPDDWHIHFRDGAAMQSVLPDTARVFGRAIAMPNLKPPVVTVADAAAYRDALAGCGGGHRFRAADDALSHRQYAARGNPPGARKRLGACGEVLPGRRHHQFRFGCH